jgi:hypothetical protein
MGDDPRARSAKVRALLKKKKMSKASTGQQKDKLQGFYNSTLRQVNDYKRRIRGGESDLDGKLRFANDMLKKYRKQLLDRKLKK